MGPPLHLLRHTQPLSNTPQTTYTPYPFIFQKPIDKHYVNGHTVNILTVNT